MRPCSHGARVVFAPSAASAEEHAGQLWVDTATGRLWTE
jgi:hypothetical protein